MVVLKRLMVRGRNECVAVQLEKHGEQKKIHVIQKVSVLQRAKVRYIIEDGQVPVGESLTYDKINH